MHKKLLLIVALMGSVLGMTWYITAQESRSLQKSATANYNTLLSSECPPEDCP